MPSSIVFGPFRLDNDAGALWRGDALVPLAPRPFALLSYLAERPGRLISKDDLLQAVWPGVFVGDSALKVAIREIRKALDDPAEAPAFIETVHGRGYRFRGPARGTRLPAPLTSFVGREAELAALRAALATSRLITLRGTGGAGKTRLARQFAAEQERTGTDGIWWVDLAGINRSNLVVPAIAAMFGIRDHRDHTLADTLADFVRVRALLLVLDNCEHVLAGCAPIVERLLAEGPRVVILTTSREPLGIPGEKVLLVPPLALPAQDAALDGVREAEAVRLFIERAQDADPTFAWRPAVAPQVAAICRRLDGLPLAIELVAARVVALSPGDILVSLDRSLTTVKRSAPHVTGRHDSLEAAIDWSYDLLALPQRRFFQQLSVFAGSFSLSAVEAVCDPAGDAAPDFVAALVNKSIVTAVDAGSGHQRRYRLLEVVRQYAREKLPMAERAGLAERHAVWFTALAAANQPSLNGSERSRATAALVAERDNLRAALGASLTADPHRALCLASSLWWWWFHTNQWREGRDWLEAALERSPADDVTRADALCGAGALAWFQGDTEQARARLDQAVTVARALDARQVLARSLDFLGQVRADLQELDAALACATEAVDVSRAIGNRWELAVALIGLGNVLLFVGRDESAEAQYEESASLCRAIPDPWVLGMALRNLGIVARRRGHLDQSLARLRDSLIVLADLDEQWFVSRTLEELSTTLTMAGEWRRATMLFGAAEALREAVGAVVLAVRHAEYAKALSQLRAALGDTEFADTWARGRSLTRDRAIGLALDTKVSGDTFV